MVRGAGRIAAGGTGFSHASHLSYKNRLPSELLIHIILTIYFERLYTVLQRNILDQLSIQTLKHLNEIKR